MEGPTLAERVARGPLALADTVAIARQVIEALEAAHAHGIVHRDLKPANIKVRPDGAVKVLDFGLAKHLIDDGASGGGGFTATVTFDGTRTGSIVGTPAYMSPEQVRGQALDARADVWAFGCVLYEMLTGRRAFAGATSSDTIAAVLERDPDWRVVPASTPESLQRLLRRCLAKDPQRRLRHVADAGLDLDDALAAPIAGTTASGPAGAPTRSSALPLLATVVAVLLAVAALAAWWIGRNTPEPPRVVSLSVLPPPGTAFPNGGGAPWPSISPDGQQLAFVALARSGEQRLWLRRLDSTSVRVLDGTDGAARPFWSPDSRSLGFFANGRLARIDVDSGELRVLAEAPYLGGLAGTWGRDTIVWKSVGGFRAVAAEGGPSRLLWPNPDGYNPVVPGFLPDGRQFVFTQLDNRGGGNQVCVGAVDASGVRCLFTTDGAVRFAAPGFLLGLRGNRLVAQRFDPERLEVSGDPMTATNDPFGGIPDFAPPPFSAAASGVLAYAPDAGPTVLTWVDWAGAPLGRSLGPGIGAALSPDQRRVVLWRPGPPADDVDLWVVDVETGAETRLTFERYADLDAVYSPDGTQVAYANGNNDAVQLFTKRVDGAGGSVALDVAGNSPDWSPDSRHLLYQTRDASLNFDLWALPLTGDRTPIPVARSEHGERAGRFAPDGRWVAYDSTESGRREVWIQPFPPTGSRWQISTTGGATPVWRGDGRELFYIAADGSLMAVPIAVAGATPTWSPPRALFMTMFAGGIYGEVAVSRDGQRFLMPVPPGLEDATPITVVVNWTAALPR